MEGDFIIRFSVFEGPPFLLVVTVCSIEPSERVVVVVVMRVLSASFLILV